VQKKQDSSNAAPASQPQSIVNMCAGTRISISEASYMADQERKSGHSWWQNAVIYQIYPRSFCDGNADGIGDLAGIINRLGYLCDLGIDAIWISPIYPSPMADFGYDVSDYVDIDPLFGDLARFDELVATAHQGGLKVILDFVPNHTSDRHPWFMESRSSRDNPKRDWYIWAGAGPAGAPPSNWLSEFGGSAWTWDTVTAQFYYHAYLSQQPDLNWRNPAVVSAMSDVMRFWLARGVDGFRVDAIHHLYEDQQLRDNPPNPAWREGVSPARRLLRQHTMDLPELQPMIAQMRLTAEEFDGDRVLIGEAYLPLDRLMAYYGENSRGFHLPFNFHLISTPWTPIAIAALIDTYESLLPRNAWPNWVLGNHDRSRLATRLGAAQARVAAMLLLTLRGTPTIYQGDEIGMRDGDIPAELVQDPWEKNVPGLGLGRDPERTPMQWDDGPHAGFSSVAPWLPIGADFAQVNVATESCDERSILALYRSLLALRRAKPALSIGSYVSSPATEQILSYERRHGSQRLLVLLNLSEDDARAEIPAGAILISTDTDRRVGAVSDSILLNGNEGVVLELAHAIE
jgi:alpha-glucosidase